jgi:hypothetical protein
MRGPLTAILLVLVACSSPETSRAAPLPVLVAPPPSADPGPDGLFKWLDGLGVPLTRDLASGRLVRSWGDDEPAFLLGDDDGVPRVLTSSLHVHWLSPPVDELRPDRFEAAPLADVVAETLADFDDGDSREQRWDRATRDAYGGLSTSGRLAVLAWTCSRRGVDAPIAALFARADEYRDADEPWPDAPTKPLAEVVREDVESALFADAYGAAWEGRPPTWERRRERLSQFLARFPDGARAAKARDGVAMLTRLIDERGRIPTVEDLAALSGDALVDALVLRLRLAAGGFGINGGPGSARGAPWGRPTTDADRLVALGDRAVPRLVAHLDDATWTDILYDAGRGTPEPAVHTVGGVVREVLQAITGKWFSNRAAGEAWLSDVGARGEAALLAEEVRTARYGIAEAAKRLVARDPALGLAALLDRVAAADREGVCEALGVLATIDAPAAETALRKAMAGDDLLVGLTAARGLRRRDVAAANGWLIEKWRPVTSMPGVVYPATEDTVNAVQAKHDAVRGIAADLGEHAGADGVAALVDGLAAKPVFPRMWAVTELVARTRDLLAPRGVGLSSAERAVQDALEDPAPLSTESAAAFPPVTGVCLRVRDVTAAALSKRFPSRFVFVGEAAESERDVRIVRMRNAFRALAAAPPLPEPPSPSALRAPAGVAAPLIAAIAAAKTREEVAVASSAIEAAGLGMLPWVRLAAASARPPHRTLDRLERRLACIVRDVVVADGAAADVVASLRACVGRPLDPTALAAAVTSLLARPDAAAIEVRLHRAGDDTGVVVDVRPASPPAAARYDLEGVSSQGGARDLAPGIANWRDEVAAFLDRSSKDRLASRARFYR